nr:glycosyltransferase family 2 protein [Desulfobacterales bacterium]
MYLQQYYPELSIVIPLYNESVCIEPNFEILDDYLRRLQLRYEMILVNDGSTDSTGAICNSIVNRNSHVRLISCHVNRGKGYAVRTGVLDALGRCVIFTDADLAVPVKFIGRCLKHLEASTPVVIGSRHLPGSSFKVRENPLREFLGEVFRRFAKLVLGLRVSDITCGLKGFERKAAFDIFSRSRIERWGYDAEIIFLAQKLGYTIREIPVDWYHSFDSKVRVSRDSIGTLIEIFRVYYYYFANYYHL